MRGRLSSVLAAFAALALFATMASASPIGFYQQTGVLANAPSYDWYYGCSPTVAGMMMGYYDINGYGGLRYDNLVPGGTAEPTTFPYPPSLSPLADAIIASPGHIHDFYGDDANRGNTNYLDSGDDRTVSLHAFDSLADFMGTSQDAQGNVDGGTTFYYFTDGSRLTAQDAYIYSVWGSDGMYGMWEYLGYAGYSDAKVNFWTQLIYSAASPFGATWLDYKALIDLGFVAMIQLDGHSVLGFGYSATNDITFYNTWDSSVHHMTWGGSYAQMDQWGITAFKPDGGTPAVPEPASLFLLGSGLLGVVRASWKRRG
jgi:hypothetical protein